MQLDPAESNPNQSKPNNWAQVEIETDTRIQKDQVVESLWAWVWFIQKAKANGGILSDFWLTESMSRI